MAIGLLIGIEFNPTPADFEDLLAKGALKERDFQYVTAELSSDEARDRNQLKEYYKAACINQNWPEGIKYADDLKFSDVVVFGKPVVIVEPKGFDEPAPKSGGIIAGIGFTPTQADLDQLIKQIKVQPGWEYTLQSYSKDDSSSETFLTAAYLSAVRQKGWAPLSGSLSIQRREINEKEFLVLQPSLPGETIDEGKKAAERAADTPSEKIIELFNREKIDPAGKKILAFALLYERDVAPTVWVGPGPDPFAVEGEDAEIRQVRFLASKIIPGYQPHFIPGHLVIDQGTAVVGRQFKAEERLDAKYINQVLSVMLAGLLGDQDLSNCSALSLSGESVALGQNRFAIVVGEEPVTTGVRFLREYTKQIIPGFDGTYKDYEAVNLDEARKFLAAQKVTEPHFYIEVHTPEGGLGKDIEGTYEFDIREEGEPKEGSPPAQAAGMKTESGEDMEESRELVSEGEKSQGEIEISADELPQDEELGQIITDLENPSEEVRKAAIERLGEIGDQSAIALLIVAFKDSELGVVWAAESTLAQIGAPAYESVLAALNNEDPAIRKGAARTLGKLGDPQAVEPLIAAMKDSDKDVRMSVVASLGLIGDDRAVEPLCRALKDKWDVGVCAAEALGNFDDPRAVEPLIDAIKHEDWSLWKYAAKALGKIGDPRAVPVLRELFKDSNEQISQAAAEALEAIKKKQQTTPVQAGPKTDQTPGQDAGRGAIINEMKQAIDRYDKAVKYLDQCDTFEFDNLVVAHRIAGTNAQESELREMWAEAKYVLPGPDTPGGVESLRPITRETFTTAAEEFQKILNEMEVVPTAQPAGTAVEAPAKPSPTKAKKPDKKRRPAWVWFLAILAMVILVSVIGFYLSRSTTSPPATSDVAVEQPIQELPVEGAESVPGAEEVQPVEPEDPIEAPGAEKQVQIEGIEDLGYLERAMAGEFSGTEVTILGRLTDQEVIIFNDSMHDFQNETGIRVVYDSNNEFESVLDMLIAAGDPPDIVDMPQPALLTNLVSDGEVIDVSQFLDMEKLQNNYNLSWLDLATMESPAGPIMAGVWHRTTNKSIVWYPKLKFEAAGYEVPKSWDELMSLTQQIAADGGSAWCIGMESGTATGWVATDWIENILIRTYPAEIYDQWVLGELPFSSPEVIQAVEIMSDIWFNEDYVYGGREAILTTPFYESPDPLFEDPPACWLHLQGPWITLYFPEGHESGVDYDFFTLPPIDETYGTPIIIYGNIMTMFNDRPEIRALMEYFSNGESVEAWVKAGAAISPHNDSSLAWYTNDTDRHIAETILEADTIRFDASDMMPPEVAFGSFWAGMADYVSGADLNTVLSTIDQSWPGAPPQPVVENGKEVILIPHPDCPQPAITSADDIVVRVRWGASSPELAESNANHFTFVLLLDGEEFDDIRPTRQPAEFYSGLDEYGCGPSQPAGWVHWDVPIGQLPAGTHTVAVEHILDETISDGMDTYPAGSLGLLEATFEVTAPSGAASSGDVAENLPDVTPTPEGGSDWRPFSFMTPNPQLWEESGDKSYTAVGQRNVDAFAWSTESFEGDLEITLDLQRPESESDGCIIIYGDGNEHSNGSLIFCVDWDGYYLHKHTIYHEGENLLAFVDHNNDTDEVYSIKIEIVDDLANMYINGELALSSFFDPQEINRSGRIGLYKKWFVGETIFSNLKIKTPDVGD
jgi:alpha-glucoside transport system substrate-binding protein